MNLPLSDLIKNLGPIGPFAPFVRYNEASDTLTFFFKDEEYIASRTNAAVTMFESLENPGQTVGFRVNDVTKLVRAGLTKFDAPGF